MSADVFIGSKDEKMILRRFSVLHCDPTDPVATCAKYRSRHKIGILVLIAISVPTLVRAADCEEQIASKAPKYQSYGLDAGVVSAGFIRPSDGRTVVHGVDVSKYQAEPNFNTIVTCGGKFAYVRLSAGTTEANEDQYRVNWKLARSAGLLVGPYHNLTVIDADRAVSNLAQNDFEDLLQRNVEHARKQAALFQARLIEVLGRDDVAKGGDGYGQPYLPAVLDVTATPQRSKGDRDQKLFAEVYRTAVCTWLEEFDRLFRGQPVILFTKPFIYRDYELEKATCELGRMNVWISYYGTTGDVPSNEIAPIYREAVKALCEVPAGHDRCILQQYTSVAEFAVAKPGLSLDRYFGDFASLQNLLQRVSWKPAEEPRK
jgi:GH25 family lysozyme M1 (1,4-beta-N-acetylmuramidase)